MSSKDPGQRRLFLNIPLFKATTSTLLISLTIWGLVLILYLLASPEPLEKDFPALPLITTVTSLCMLFYALILPLSTRIISKQAVLHLTCALALNLILCLFPLPLLYNVFPLTQGYTSRNSYITFFAVLFILNYGWFIFVRVAIRVILYWNRLRRKHLHWALTHAHVMVLLLGLMLLILMIEAAILFSFRERGWLAPLEMLPALFFLLGLCAIPIVVVVPPTALFSYSVMKRTTDRIRMLAMATSMLRQGDYTIRVPVVGEDEVAQLQENFNVMASDLQHAMRDLQNERDRVAALLQERRELVANV
jgi:HAMP domain-containing protein